MQFISKILACRFQCKQPRDKSYIIYCPAKFVCGGCYNRGIQKRISRTRMAFVFHLTGLYSNVLLCSRVIANGTREDFIIVFHHRWVKYD